MIVRVKEFVIAGKRHLRKLEETGVHHLWFQASASGWILWLPR